MQFMQYLTTGILFYEIYIHDLRLSTKTLLTYVALMVGLVDFCVISEQTYMHMKMMFN